MQRAPFSNCIRALMASAALPPCAARLASLDVGEKLNRAKFDLPHLLVPTHPGSPPQFWRGGNGRVGRFLSNIILLENKYPPIVIRKTQRDSYIKCLEDFHRGYTVNLERFFLEKYKKTYRKFFSVYLKYING